MSVKIIWDDGQFIESVAQFYHSQGYSGGVRPEDKLLVCLDESEVVGVVRLSLENEVWILRGMQIREDFQRKGLGTRMIKVLENEFGDSAIFCLPHDYLEGFYGQIKFEKVGASDLPEFLGKRLKKYNDMGHSIIAMKRPSIKRPSYKTIQNILSTWGESAEPLFIRKVENYVYAVDDKDLILRVTSSEHRSKELLLDELSFVDLLSQNQVAVSSPLKSHSGHFVEEIKEGSDIYFASLFHRAPGSHISGVEDYRPEIFKELGKTLGKSHKTISKVNGKWERPLWNKETGFLMASTALDPSDKVPYETFQNIIETFNGFPSTRDVFGLIHGDAHHGNFLVDGDKITLFDFDDSQVSWFMYDLAVPIFSFEFRLTENFSDPSHSKKCEAALIEGYLNEYQIGDEWIKKIPLFVTYRAVLLYHWAKARIKKGDLEPDGILRCKEIMDYTLSKMAY